MPMHGRTLRRLSSPVDGRSLFVECPEHKGLILPVTEVMLAREPTGARRLEIFLEALCKFCDKYHYVTLAQGPVGDKPPYPWNA